MRAEVQPLGQVVGCLAKCVGAVEYELTALGRGVLDPMEQLVKWIGENWSAIERARVRFDERARRDG